MTNRKNTNNGRFTIDFLNKTIWGTKASFDMAGKGISPMYEELVEKMNAHPTFVCKVKGQKKNTRKPKRTYNGMNFAFMEAFISLQNNKEILTKEYNSVKEYAKKQKLSVYPFTKKWFLGEFDPDNKGFDMKKALVEITQAGIDCAIFNAHEEKTEEAA